MSVRIPHPTMTPLSAITGLTPEAADLLSAAGIRSAARLSLEDPASLHPRLEVIAWQRGRSAQAPPRGHLEHWVALARLLTTPRDVEEMGMEEIPEAVVVPTGPGPWMAPAVRAASEATGLLRPGLEGDALRQQNEDEDHARRRVDPANFATIEAYNEGRISVQPLSRDSLTASPPPVEAAMPAAEDDFPRRPARIRSTGEPLSRWIKRGVVHPRPLHTWLGAVTCLLWRLGLAAGVVGFTWLLMFSRDATAHTTKVIVCSSGLLLLGCLQLHFGGRCRCRICSCNLFFSKNCHKNRKAHLLYGLGYVGSAALHLLLFGWLRCMYCGTAIRLHPGKDKREESE